MIDNIFFCLTLFSALGSGLIAGVFFAFSAFVMRALAGLEPREGIRAMQAINRTVINPLFLAVFFGTAAICIPVTISALLNWHHGHTVHLLAGTVLYVGGTVLVTVVFNVPLNEALATRDPVNGDAPAQWASYLANWTVWNHVRTGAALLSAAALMLAL